MNKLFKYGKQVLSIMFILLIQVLAAVLRAFIALLLLKKDSRTTTEAIRKESFLLKKIIVPVTIFSILNLGVSFYIAQFDKDQLEKDEKDLKTEYAKSK